MIKRFKIFENSSNKMKQDSIYVLRVSHVPENVHIRMKDTKVGQLVEIDWEDDYMESWYIGSKIYDEMSINEILGYKYDAYYLNEVEDTIQEIESNGDGVRVELVELALMLKEMEDYDI